MKDLVLDPRKHDREGANAVRGAWAFPTLPWRIFRYQPHMTFQFFLP